MALQAKPMPATQARGVAARPGAATSGREPGKAEKLVKQAKGMAVGQPGRGRALAPPGIKRMTAPPPGGDVPDSGPPVGAATGPGPRPLPPGAEPGGSAPGAEPAWRQLARMGVANQGSHVANKAELARLQAGQLGVAPAAPGGGMQPAAPGEARMAPDGINRMSDDGQFQTMIGAGRDPQQIQSLAQQMNPWQQPFNDALRRRMQAQGGGMPGAPGGPQGMPMPGQVPGQGGMAGGGMPFGPGGQPGGMQGGFGGNPQGFQIRQLQDLYGGGQPAPPGGMGFRPGAGGQGGFQRY